MAARTLNRLTGPAIKAASRPGLYADGGGLYLRVDATSKRWVFIFQWRGRRSEMGLGSIADVSLAEARVEREAARKLVLAGVNPIEQRRLKRLTVDVAQQTFGEWAEEIAPAIGPKATKARKAWVAMMRVKVGDLAKMAPDQIQTEHVLRALKPYWESRPESGKRMRQRIERVLDAAKAKGLIADPWSNPARLRGHLENLLAKRSTAVKHHAALPFDQVSDFVGQLRGLDRMPARALEFTILTCVRNGEARGARWREIDRQAKVWTIPAERMKGEAGKKREHRVPLSAAALALLDLMGPGEPDALIFPHPRSGKVLSENALQGVVNDMGFKGVATVHGFRSTFRDWAGEMTNFQRETIEAALAHRMGDDTEKAYRRGDALLKRRKLMEAWAGYIAGQSGNVAWLGRRPS